MQASQKVSKEKLKTLYTEMLRIRIIEEELAREYEKQEMRCPVHFCIGQEATAVAVCQLLDHEDTVMSTHRSHGHYLAKGGSLRAMVAEFYGKESGCSSGKGGSMHIIDKDVNFLGAASIVSGTIPVSVGVAFANKLQARGGVSVAFFGDAATEAGPFYESLNFAALHKLPVLFVCENNSYSTLTPIDVRQPASRKIYKVAQSLGVDSEKIDGNNVMAVSAGAKRALKHIRSSNGPYFIEAITYRHLEHCGPNYDHLNGHRSKEEFDRWSKKDPLALFEKTLLADKVISSSFVKKATDGLMKEVAEAIEYAKSEPLPDIAQLTRDVYAK